MVRVGKVFKEFVNQGNAIVDWYEDEVESKKLSIADLVRDAGGANRIAVFCVDMINGFCKEGNLASPRINAISSNIVDLFVEMHHAGVENFVLAQEWHSPEAKEFASFGAHGVGGTKEAETVPELLELPFSKKFRVFRKNCISPIWAYGRSLRNSITAQSFTDFLELARRENMFKNAIVVGNCTDLCVRELAMCLRLWANEFDIDLRVIIPANCVETFDLPQDVAEKIGAKPHPGDMMHFLALYEMSRNGIDIVQEIL